jgi:hypothetical protein
MLVCYIMRRNWSHARDLRPALPITNRLHRCLCLHGKRQSPRRDSHPHLSDFKPDASSVGLHGERRGPLAHGNARGRLPEAARQGATRGSESVNAEGRPARLMAHSRHPAGCATHSLSHFVRLSGSPSLNWSPRKELHPDDEVRSLACSSVTSRGEKWSAAPDSHRVRTGLQAVASTASACGA